MHLKDIFTASWCLNNPMECLHQQEQ